MLLVHDEEARVGNRRKGRGARADHGAGLPPADAVPGLGPLAFREGGVQDGRPLAKLAGQLTGEDGRQRDLGHQPDGPPTGLQSRANRPQVHLGLAAAGHPLEQRRSGATRARIAARPALVKASGRYMTSPRGSAESAVSM